MTDLGKLTCLVVDNGLNLGLAKTLGRTFAKCYYWMPWASAFPTINQAVVGTGFDEIERIENLDDYLDSVDLIVCPDNYYGAWTAEQRRLGRRVWGAGYSEKMELDRWWMRQLQSELGLPTQATDQIVGITALEKYCAENPETFIKLSRYRGVKETFPAKQFETVANELRVGLGQVGETFKFLAEEKIEGVEWGLDSWNIRGRYPETVLHGLEVKDAGYVGAVCFYDDLPKPLKRVTDALTDTFAKLDGRTFCSFEVRVDEKEHAPYLVDSTIRMPVPPGPAYGLLWANLPEVVYAGAGGEVVMPVATGRFVVIARIHSNYAATNWLRVKYPKEYEQHIKFSNACKIDGETWIVPQPGKSVEIGDVCVVGDSLKACESAVNEIAEGIEGHEVEVQTHALSEAEEQLEQAEKLGLSL